MGKRIKSTGVILDASSMASAPVSPAGTVALRAKSDATQFQYSANGGAWTDFGTGGGGGTVRLDQVLDPAMAAPQVKAFSMTDHSLVFSYTATQAEECFVITSTTPVTPEQQDRCYCCVLMERRLRRTRCASRRAVSS